MVIAESGIGSPLKSPLVFRSSTWILKRASRNEPKTNKHALYRHSGVPKLVQIGLYMSTCGSGAETPLHLKGNRALLRNGSKCEADGLQSRQACQKTAAATIIIADILKSPPEHRDQGKKKSAKNIQRL